MRQHLQSLNLQHLFSNSRHDGLANSGHKVMIRRRVCCSLAGAKEKSHAMFSACQLGPRAMPQSHCERPCVPVQGLLILCGALNSAVGGRKKTKKEAVAFSYSCSRR